MRLHSPQFEKRLRRSVRKTVRASRELRREFRAANKYRKHYHIMLLVRPAISLLFAMLACYIAHQTGHPASGLAVIGLWAFIFAFIHAQRLLSSLYSSGDLPALLLLPAPEATIFRWELQRAFRGALWSLFDLLSAYMALAAYYHLPPDKWLLVIPLALLAWVEALALAALCAARLPRLPYSLASAGLFVFVGIVFLARDFIGAALIDFLDRCAPGLNLLLPTGWPASVLQTVLPGGHWISLLLLLPIGALIWTLKPSLARLRANYRFQEPVHPQAHDLIPGEPTEPAPAAQARSNDAPHLGLTAIEQIIRSRQFLAAPAWHQHGWFEGLLWRRLSPRERVLTEFVFPSGLSIGAAWTKIFRNLGLTVLATALTGFLSLPAQYWVLAGGLFVTVCQVIAQILVTGRAFQPFHCSGVNIPIYAGYAVGFRELSGLLLKCSVVQIPLLVPFAALCGVLVAYMLRLPVAYGAVFGLKVGGLLFAGRFLATALAFSSGTNDTSLVRLRSAALLFLVVALALGFAGLGAASLFVPRQSLAWCFWALAALDSYLLFRVYGWFYHANRFDLMSLPRR